MANAITMIGKEHNTVRLWDVLIKHLVHSCFDRKWQNKVGSAIGLKAVCEALPATWLLKHDVEIFKGVTSMLQNHHCIPSTCS